VRAVLAFMICAACARGHEAASPGTNKLPPWLEYHRVSGGLKLDGSIDQHVKPERQPADPATKLTRVVIGMGDGFYNLITNIDAAGVVREWTGDFRTTAIVPFTATVIDYAPTSSPWFATPRHVAVVEGGAIEIVGDGDRWRFPNAEGFTSTAETCFARELPSTEPLPCFSKLPRLQMSVVLEQDSTIGPLSRVEWNALKTTDRYLLAGWEAGGGPRSDAEVLQIVGAWGRSEGDWNHGYRPALVCGVLADHTVACWGTSQFYELGDGTRSEQQRYVHVPGLTDVAEVAVGPDFACARTTAGKVWCWGDAAAGAFPLPKHPSGGSIPGCAIDEDATNRAYRDAVARAQRAADACNRSACAPGTLDCHLGCGPNHFERTPIYRRDGVCTTTKVYSRPQLLDLSDVVSIGAGNSTACFVFATGYTTCGGG